MVLRRIRRLRPAALALSAAVAAASLPAVRGTAQDRAAAIGRVHVAASGESPSTDSKIANIRLYYMATPWPKVLEEVAAAAGLTLVMHDTPPGNFTRNDFHKHPIDETVRILNRELEPLGHRLLANEEFLTVIRAERARPEYPRRELETRPGGAPTISEDDGGQSGVQTAEYVVEETPHPAIVRASDERPAGSTSADAKTSTRLTPQSRPAVEISRDIFSAFEDRSTVQERGPNGLPAFTVWRDAPEAEGSAAGGARRSGEWFTLELDTASNTILITAADRVAAGVGELVRRLDAVPRTEGETTRVLAGGDDLPQLADQLRPQLEKLKGDGVAGTRALAWQPQPATGAGPAPAGEAVPALPGGDVAPSGIESVMGNLRGDVQIQSVDDLNLLILRGNEADVEQVLQVIDLIERMAQGSQPQIHLLNLEHVSSESLAALLTDIYERLTTQQEEAGRQPPRISVVPVVQPNAILILAPESAMESILTLARELDKPSDPAAEVHVYRLKFAIASQVVTLLEDFYEDRPGLGTRVRVIADPRTNSLIIQARPRELAEVELLIKQVDRDTAGATHQARVFPLQHASATELAEFLNTSIQSIINPAQTTTQQGFGAGGTGQNSQQLRDSKSVVLEFLQTNGDVKRLVKSGLLTDIRINGDPRTNTLLITGPKDSLPMLAELVKALDQPSMAVASVKMIPLKSTDAVAAVELLTTLFEPQQEEALGVQLAGAESSSSLVPMRFQADPRSNTVIAYGDAQALTMVEAILLRLDTGNSRDRRTEVLKLRNAPAADVAAAINTFLQSQRDLLQLDPDRVSTFELLEQEVVVTPEPVNNYLLISATPKYYERILAMARELDSEPPQVMIQALLVEVELNDTDEFGVELGFQDPILFARSVIDSLVTTQTTTNTPGVGSVQTTNVISQSATPGFLFNNGNPLGNNTAITPGRLGAQSLSNFALGRTNADLGFGGLVLSASSQSVNVLIRALASRRNVRILSRPQVLALDNQPASIQVGQQVPIVNGVNSNTIGVASPIVEQDDAGIILTVQPRISPEGEIVMVVAAEKSAFTGAGVPIFTDTAGNVFESPIKDITTASTTVKVPDGQTIVVGGMITKSDTTIERKVPWLGDVPVVKNLFRYDSHTERRTELLIFLTPRIVRGDGDSELIKQVEAERLHFFEEEAEAIHGPLFGVPPEEFGMPIGSGTWSEGTVVPQPDAVFSQPRPDPAEAHPTPKLLSPTPAYP